MSLDPRDPIDRELARYLAELEHDDAVCAHAERHGLTLEEAEADLLRAAEEAALDRHIAAVEDREW